MSGARSSSAIGTTGIVEPEARYRGRFAPSPTGPLHFGSLVAALGSYLDARAHAGEWLLRVEDLDPPREVPGAADAIIRTLDRLGLHWDGPILYQSTRSDAYGLAIDRLAALGLTSRCRCSRSALSALPENRDRSRGEELYHPPECVLPLADESHALRMRAPDEWLEFRDRSQGVQRDNLARSIGDFVLKRRDGLFAYQLAVVVDDAAQGVTQVVRGSDLLPSTIRQITLQRALGLPEPGYMHLPLAVGADGLKLSKSDDAPGLELASPGARLVAALEFLRQGPPSGLEHSHPAEVLGWAVRNWRPERFAGLASQPVDRRVLGSEEGAS
ncbi:MAG TPA: tRNA glutamyl-Q(34) synthetase GluQRS [Steroidobacteraceae bacterium]|nr:tRNA glutamyl-Q(34) synthetase GluQRS [Steroidobacteraceae bacterium]